MRHWPLELALSCWAGLASAGSRSLGPNLRQSELAQAHSYWAEWAEGPAQAVHNGKHDQSAGNELTTNHGDFELNGNSKITEIEGDSVL